MIDHLLIDKLTLHVKIDDESQVFSKYSYTEDNLNEDFSTYLLEKAEQAFPLPAKYNFIVNIHTNQNLRLPEITRGIHHHFHNEYDTEKRNLRNNLRFALILFALGLFVLTLRWVVRAYVDNYFLAEILNITSWVFIWDAVGVSILERHKIHRKCIILRRLAYAEVTFSSNTKLDAPVYI